MSEAVQYDAGKNYATNCYFIQKITNEVVDDDYPALRYLSMLEKIQEDPEFKSSG